LSVYRNAKPTALAIMPHAGFGVQPVLLLNALSKVVHADIIVNQPKRNARFFRKFLAGSHCLNGVPLAVPNESDPGFLPGFRRVPKGLVDGGVVVPRIVNFNGVSVRQDVNAAGSNLRFKFAVSNFVVKSNLPVAFRKLRSLHYARDGKQTRGEKSRESHLAPPRIICFIFK